MDSDLPALDLWRAICDEAECVVLPGGKKRLLLTEEMCIRLGATLEAGAPQPSAVPVGAVEALRRDVKALHCAQTINNQNYPNAWHEAIDAALECIDAHGDSAVPSSPLGCVSEDVAAIKAALAAGPTPGPWFANFKIWTGGPVLSDGGCFQILDNENENQANVLCSRNPWDERADEMRANARLIAACHPERMARLIDALENAAAQPETIRPDDAAHGLLQDEAGRGAKQLSKALAGQPGARWLVDQQAAPVPGWWNLQAAPSILVDECAPYLKEGETPLQRIERDHRDTLALMRLLAAEKIKNEALAAERERPTQEWVDKAMELSRACESCAYTRYINLGEGQDAPALEAARADLLAHLTGKP